ncbi:hypothetical protein [Staphylococcus phage LY01]|nr:hypothetical protein [Staphylococcus phage LY01]
MVTFTKKDIEKSMSKLLNAYGGSIEILNYSKGMKKKDLRIKYTCEKGHEKYFDLWGNAKCAKRCVKCYEEKHYLTGREFLSKFKEIYGDKFTYPNLDLDKRYNKSTYIEIKCEKHGTFKRSISNHLLRFVDCPKCQKERDSKNKILTKEQFLKNVFKRHPEYEKKYDYSEAVYTGRHCRLKLRCKKHNRKFEIIAVNHYSKRNNESCPDCVKEKIKRNASISKKETPESLFKKWKKGDKDFRKNYIKFNIDEKNEFMKMKLSYIHNNKYDYSELRFNNFNKDHVIIKCKKHGRVRTSLRSHSNGYGCRKCALEKTAAIKREKAGNFTGKPLNKKDIPLISIKTNFKKYTPFELFKDKNLNNREKGMIAKIQFNQKQKNEFYKYKIRYKRKDQLILDKFNFQYDYDKAVSIFGCKKHGYFESRVENIIKGGGCPKCKFAGPSSLEDTLFNIIKKYTLYQNIKISNRLILGNRKEIDIFIEDIGLGIEVNGLRWHSNMIKDEHYAKTHQKEKMDIMENKGYKLINLYEDQFFNKYEHIKNQYSKILKEILLFGDKNLNIDKEIENNLEIRKISYTQIKEFYKNHSLDFFNKEDKFYKGIFYKNTLISVFSYNNKGISNNYCTNYRTNADIDLILNQYPNIIFNLRSDSYNKYKFKEYGFVSIEEESPDYRNFRTKGKVKYRSKRLEKKDPNNPNRIYDCGRTIMIY